MNDRHENKLSMALAVKDVLLKFNSVVKTLPAFTMAAFALDNGISVINGHAKIQAIKRTGKRIDKDAAAADAVDSCIALTGPAKAYAVEKGDHELFEKIDYSRSYLLGLRDSTLPNVLYGIRDTIQAELDNLGGYGVGEDGIDSFSESTALYDGLIGSPRAGISERRNATEALVKDFEDLDKVLERLDGFADLKKATDPDFYRTYYAAREIVDNRGRTADEEIKQVAG